MRPAGHSHIVVHTSATDFLAATKAYLLDPEETSGILEHALQAKSLEYIELGDRSASLWLTLWTRDGHLPPTLDLVVSCPRFPDLRESSVVIYTTTDLIPNRFYPSVSKMVTRLSDLVPRERVLSVLGPTPLAKEFARRWGKLIV